MLGKLSSYDVLVGNIDENDVVEEFITDIVDTTELDRLFHESYMREATARYSHLQRLEEVRNNTPYIFLTINPNSHITFREFQKVMTKMMSKVWIKQYLYVFEQRGEGFLECGKGFHFHAIIKKQPSKSYQHMVRELSSSANKVCDTSNYHFFNLKNISEEEKERKIVYITGRKADTAKHLKQDMDVLFRQENNLLSYYNIGIIEDAV